METRPSRRELLAVGGLALLSSASLRALVTAGEAETRMPRFQIPLPIPDVLNPVKADATTDYYEIVQREAALEIPAWAADHNLGLQRPLPGPDNQGSLRQDDGGSAHERAAHADRRSSARRSDASRVRWLSHGPPHAGLIADVYIPQ